MGIFKTFIRQIKSLFKKEDAIIYVAPCGTVVKKLVDTIDIEEGKEVAKFNSITGKLYWPSDGSEANGPGIRDIPLYKNKDKVNKQNFVTMTQEEKLEEAKRLYETANADQKYVLERLFPEFKESEDERMRKHLIGVVELYYGNTDEQEKKDCLAWLDKQGEHKPDTQHSTEWSVYDFRTWQYIVSDVLTKKAGIGQYLDSGECKKIAKYMQEEWGEKLGKEQTQEELRKGEDFGIDGLYAAIDILKKTLGKVDGYQTDDGILEHKCAISAVKSLYEQKPAWSEEDNMTFNSIADSLQREGVLEKKRKMDWLKSLKDRVQPQPKQEWSEEDNDKIYQILAIIDDYRRFYTIKPSLRKALLKDLDNIESWLKSLRPQNTTVTDEELAQAKKDAYNDVLDKLEYDSENPTFDDGWSAAIWYLKKRNAQPHNTWKPSDEQMITLRQVISGCSYDIEPLVEIEEYLKKLKE